MENRTIKHSSMLPFMPRANAGGAERETRVKNPLCLEDVKMLKGKKEEKKSLKLRHKKVYFQRELNTVREPRQCQRLITGQ